METNESKLKALREHIQQAIERGGSHTDEEVRQALENRRDSQEDQTPKSKSAD